MVVVVLIPTLARGDELAPRSGDTTQLRDPFDGQTALTRPPCRALAECIALMARANARQDFTLAQQAAEQAYRAHPDPNILRNLARFHRRQGHTKVAIDFYQRFLNSDAESLTDAVRAEVQENLRKLRAELNQPPQSASPGRPALGWRTYLGLPTGGLGLVLVGLGGAALWANNQCVDPPGCYSRYRSLEQGLGLVLPGLLVAGAGLTLLGVDLHRHRQPPDAQP